MKKKKHTTETHKKVWNLNKQIIGNKHSGKTKTATKNL